MRNMSFALTTPQILAREKTVTRRLGWLNLKRGERVQAVKKCMGLKPGEKLEKLCVIEVVDVRREPLDAITIDEVAREGFPLMSPDWFIEFFCKSHKGCRPTSVVTRIEFDYTKHNF
jgi:hypothetical protein